MLGIIVDMTEDWIIFERMYDGQEHTPKLLQCSHTVCLHCLTRIAASQTRDTGSFRCPICRELINIPRGGVSALPPSFLVNQLLDLMSRQRRELSQAQEGVSSELNRLDAAKEACLEQVNTTFQQIQALMDQRKQEIVDNVNSLCAEKRRVLEEQHSLIECEKNKVEQECQGLQYQVEVRNITQRIEILSEKLDATTTLGEPRENSFLTCDFNLNDSLEQIQQHLSVLGKVRTSTTFPSLCSARLEGDIVAGIENCVTLTTVDYHGNGRKNGGDPVQAELLAVTADQTDQTFPLRVVDCDDGTYKIYFRATKAGRYGIKISVIDRPIKDNPLYFDVTEHNNPLCIYGSRGSGKDEFLQPVAVAIDERDQTVYVLDTGNSRVKVLSEQLEFLKHVTNEGLGKRDIQSNIICKGRYGGITVDSESKILVSRTEQKGRTYVQLLSLADNSLNQCIDSHDAKLKRPSGLATTNDHHVIVVDLGNNCIKKYRYW
ncbi:hypothetical protein NQ314_003182 [Rhamnusium bicolor]|uniref:RING-type domain-containing protein n=1 Tax=Rhamnusium bicolor TaxID=1586634 RepID=A0AAV8ZPU6_9CUCU|nr:hypothetical protein NQ314_003182 [Rhamnusium bicolor]